MALVFVSVGSNLDKEKNIVSGIRMLQDHFGTLDMSSVYLSAAVGFEGDDFFNMIVSFATDLSPQGVASVLGEIEKAHGRVKHTNRYMSRGLDLDQILYDDLVCEQSDICLPRKEIVDRAFVLVPLAELAGAMKHPVLSISYSDLCDRLDDPPVLEKVELCFNA